MTASKKQKNPSREGGDYTSSYQRGCFVAFSCFQPTCLFGGGCHSLPGPHCKTAPVPSERQK